MTLLQRSCPTKGALLVACVVLLLGIGSALCFDTYYMDHQVTEKHAREAIDKAYNHSLKHGRPNWCGVCTEQINNYCLSQYLIQDHCCCDQAHSKENMPWMPHSCYMGEDICKPVAKSCVEYMQRRQCCCDRLLIEFLHQEYSSAIAARAYLLLGLCLPIVMQIINS